MFKKSFSNIVQTLGETATKTRERLRNLQNTIATNISRLLPDVHTDISTMKQEIWTDLSHLYYKYDHPTQKTAFREVLKELSRSINDDRWPTAYKRIYRTNNSPRL